MIPRRKILFTSLILIASVIAGITPTEATPHYGYTPLGQTSTNSSVSIINITDGIGLSLTLHNKGITDIHNMQLTVSATGGLFVRFPKKTVNIPMLSTGSSTTVHVRLFGIGLGKSTSYPNITVKVNGPDVTTNQRKIKVRLFGPFTRIIMIYPDPDASYPGYTLFSPEYSQLTYLLNTSSSVVHMWNSSYIQGIGLNLLENGNLLRTGLLRYCQPFLAGGATGCVEILDWNNTLVWHYEYSVEYQHSLHHGVKMLPNGDILMIAWVYKTGAEAIAAGRNPSTLTQNQLWPDQIIEVKPTGPTSGDIVWEWHMWDHLIQDYNSSKANYGVVADHPELIDINFLGTNTPTADWTHTNAIDYNATYDQILISVRNFGEVWVIDHSTTSQEAAGHTGGRYGKGGDLLYRWGNPQAYRAGDATDQKLFGQHDAQWIPSGCPGTGDILVFNNGVGRPGGRYSTVDEFIPPKDAQGNYTYTPGAPYGPKRQSWIYTAENPFTLFALVLSGVQRLPNGNTLICNSLYGVFYEVTPESEVVWQYTNTFHYHSLYNIDSTDVPNVKRYPLDYPGVKLLH